MLFRSSSGISLTNYHSIYAAPEASEIIGKGAQAGFSTNIPETPFIIGGEANVSQNKHDHQNPYYGGTIYAGIGTPGASTYLTCGITRERCSFNIFELFKND